MRTPVARRHGGRTPRREVVVTCAFPSLLFAAALAAAAGCPTRALAQQPVPPPIPAPIPVPPSATATLAPYRAPLLALVQPAVVAAPGGTSAAGSVPRDKPVVVFRFAAGEADDPLDVRSFVVAVDGADRTALFQTTVAQAGGQAWGPLASDEQRARGELAVGAHRVVARICSTRGACATADEQVLVVPGVVDESETPSRSKGKRVLGAVLGVARRLIGQ